MDALHQTKVTHSRPRSLLLFLFVSLVAWWLGGADSLRLLLLDHLHDPAEAGRPQRRAARALLPSVVQLTFAALLRQLRQHHFVVLVPLHNHVVDYWLDPLVVVERASDPLLQHLLLSRRRPMHRLNLHRLVLSVHPSHRHGRCLHWRSKFVRVNHDTGGRLLLDAPHLRCVGRSLANAARPNARPPRHSSASCARHLPAGHTVAHGLARLLPF